MDSPPAERLLRFRLNRLPALDFPLERVSSTVVDEQHEQVRARLQNRLTCRPIWVTLADRSHDDFHAYADLVASGNIEEPRVDIDDDDLCTTMYTGGTTDLPKGLLYTHKAEYIGTFASRTLNWGYRRGTVCPSGPAAVSQRHAAEGCCPPATG